MAGQLVCSWSPRGRDGAVGRRCLVMSSLCTHCSSRLLPPPPETETEQCRGPWTFPGTGSGGTTQTVRLLYITHAPRHAHTDTHTRTQRGCYINTHNQQSFTGIKIQLDLHPNNKSLQYFYNNMTFQPIST
jgi:hypothetical protein